MNPLDSTGPEFLGLYIGLLIILIPFAIWLRRYFSQPDDTPDVGSISLDPYEVAYLANGEQLAINAAMAQLVQATALGVLDGKLTTLGKLPENVHEMERMVYTAVAVKPGCSVRDVHSALSGSAQAIGERLKGLGLIVADDAARSARTAPIMLFLTLAAFGAVKIYIGVERNKPVAFLVILTIATLIGSLIAFARRPHRTRWGNQLLDRLKDE